MTKPKKSDDESSSSRARLPSTEQHQAIPMSPSSQSQEPSSSSGFQRSPGADRSMALSPSPRLTQHGISDPQPSELPVSKQAGSTPPDPVQDEPISNPEKEVEESTQTSTKRQLRSMTQAPQPEASSQVKPAKRRGRRNTVVEDPKSGEAPKQDSPKDPKASSSRAPLWTPVNRRENPEPQKESPSLNSKELKAKWKVTTPQPEKYPPEGWIMEKPEEWTPEKRMGQDICENAERCLALSYAADKTAIDHLKRAQKRLREEYLDFEDEIDARIVEQKVDEEQHKRLRKIRKRVQNELLEFEADLSEFEKKKDNDHKRVLEYLGFEQED